MTPARAARERADLSIHEVAKMARISPAYLRRLEASGGFPYHLAARLARLYRCSGAAFLFTGSRFTGSRFTNREETTTNTPARTHRTMGRGARQ